MEKTVSEIAAFVGGKFYGDGSVIIRDVKSAESAGPGDATFARGIYAEHIEEMQEGVILVDELPAKFTKNLIVVKDCRRSFGELIDLYHPEPKYTGDIHPTAIISDTAVVGHNVTVMPYAVIDDGAVIGDNTVIFPYVYIGKNVRVGVGCELNPGAVIHENSILGDRVVLRSHAVIGGQGFGFSTDKQGHHTHIRQLGKAVLKDDVEVGASSAVDNGAMNDTVIGRGTKIDNLVHLGHNVEVGEDCFIIAQVGIAGSTKIGNSCTLAGQTGITGHIHITDNVTLGGKTGVLGDIDKPGLYVGYPSRPHSVWGREQVMVTRLPDLMKRVKHLEKLLAEKDDKK